MLPRLAKNDQVVFGILYDGKVPVSVELSYIYRDTVYFAHGTYNPEYRKLSPGSVSTSKFIEYFCDKNYKDGDFLAGFAHYINDWAGTLLSTKDTVVYKLNGIFFYYAVCRIRQRIKGKLKSLSNINTMEVKILTRKEALSVDKKAWEQLANDSYFTNPFYERWMLAPALEFLQLNDEVRLVVAYKNNELIALFPIKIVRTKWGLRYLTVWKHKQCYLTDPLCSNPVELSLIINRVIRKLKVSVLRITHHSLYSYGRYIDQHSVVFRATRGAILDLKSVREYLLTMPRKVRLENKRIYKRFFEQAEATYATSDDNSTRNWLEEYCRLEHSGWKRKVNGSILSSPGELKYYQALYQKRAGERKNEISGTL